MMKIYEVRFSGELDVKKGALLEDFSCPWKSGAIPKTQFRAVWNNEYLKFHFEVEDHDLVLTEHADSGEAALGSDRVELFFATSPELTTPYYGAEMDPRGNVYDYEGLYHRQINPAWSFESLAYSGTFFEGGYSVEGSFAISELEQLGCLQGGEMSTGVYRAEFSHGEGDSVINEWICWVDPETEVPDFHVPSSFGKFKLV
ncbi:sugar-binding protein [Verrucomicrobiales bacterium BCK34]|nr:sugar-binding protein [Verrucomicrobiales bacterium BCK34]